MDESVVRHLTTTKLSDLIRKGHGMIGETQSVYLQDGCGCALGAAWVGSGRTENEFFHTHPMPGAAQIADALGIPYALALEVSDRHYNGESRLSIADWLESQGY